MFSKAGKLHDDLKKRQVDDTLDGKNAFQCFWSDPKTRVFECFWASLYILDGKMLFSVFGQTQKHVFLGVVERPASVFFRGGRWPARGRPAPDPCRLPPLRRRVIDVFVWLI